MPRELETAVHPEKLKRVVIEPVTRVEGHGKVTLLLDEDNRVHQARFHIVEFRGFEKFIQGRPYTEVPVLVQRLCGICPVSHNLAASKAMDVIVGATPPPAADKLRRLMHMGQMIFDHVDYSYYGDYIHEGVKSWSYMKFPFIRSQGREEGWYRVGPLARVNNCDFIPTPLAEAERKIFKEYDEGRATHATLSFHWARMIEMLHSAEAIRELLHDDDLLSDDLVNTGERQLRGVGVIEAPRGTLIHHYHINEDEQIVRANLIVATTHNNQAMNEAIRQVALQYLDGQQLTEGLLNYIEVAIRAFDPCLSCATHALGKMPLEVELINAEGARVQHLIKHSDGKHHA